MERKLLTVSLLIGLCIVLLVAAIFFVFHIKLSSCILIVLSIALLCLLGWFLQWALRPMGPVGDIDSLLTEEEITWTKGKFGYFLQKKGSKNTNAIIFYPGGRVRPLSYLPLLQKIVLNRCPVYLVKMPFNMAVFDYRRAEKVMAENPEIRNWVIGGHSLGGAMAVHFLREHPRAFKGMFLWGAYPSRRDDISNVDIPMLTVFGSCDGITTVEKIEASRHLYPVHAHWMKLEGGNHAQFGCYGNEKQDHPAEISVQEQQCKVIGATLDFLDEVCGE